MNSRYFPELQERYYEQRLENGLLVRVIPKPGFARSFAFLAADFGSIDTDFSLNGQRYTVPDGIAHYLEHKMFDMPYGNAMEEFAKYGGSNNAFTNYTMTAYYVECTDQFAENLKILLQMVTTPYFTEESVEKERGIIAQEIKMYEDSADSVSYESLFALMYQEHPVRVPIAGTVESISHITAKTLTDCHRCFYAPGNMMLCVMGDVDPELVLRLAQENTPQIPVPETERHYGSPEPLTGHESRTEREMEVSMPTFVIGFKCAPEDRGDAAMRQEILGDLAAELLAGESSELYQKLYEEGVIDSDFSIGMERMKGMAMLEASGDSDEPGRVLEELLARAAKLADEGVDRQHFDRLKKSMLGRRTRELDGFESTCYRMCAYYFDGVEYFDFPRIFQTIRAEDVEQFLRENVIRERAAISVIYPKESQEEEQ